MVSKPTPKKESFAIAYHECGNASEAYRKSYSAEDMKPSTVSNRASELLKDGYVTGRLKELKEKVVERHNVTVDSLMIELEEARAVAKDGDAGGAMVSASLGKAKLAGLLVDKKELVGNKDNPLHTTVSIVHVTPGDKDD